MPYYFTGLFMFRRHHVNNLPEIFNDYFVSNHQIRNHVLLLEYNSVMTKCCWLFVSV